MAGGCLLRLAKMDGCWLLGMGRSGYVRPNAQQVGDLEPPDK